MKARYYLLGCLTLVSCDEASQLETAGPVVVNFAQPFPATSPDLPGFLPRDRGQYIAPDDTGKVFLLREKALIKRYFGAIDVDGEQLDILHISRQAGSGISPKGTRYSVQPLAADSFRLRIEVLDTLMSFTGPQAPRLRYYQGYYYTNTPSRLDSTKWTVRRLAVANGHIRQQLFNPDSLRVRALDPVMVQRRRTNGQLILTLAPQSRRAVGQVSSYAGLWLDLPTARPAAATTE
jgi:hypothetical protein